MSSLGRARFWHHLLRARCFCSISLPQLDGIKLFNFETQLANSGICLLLSCWVSLSLARAAKFIFPCMLRIQRDIDNRICNCSRIIEKWVESWSNCISGFVTNNYLIYVKNLVKFCRAKLSIWWLACIPNTFMLHESISRRVETQNRRLECTWSMNMISIELFHSRECNKDRKKDLATGESWLVQSR